MRILGRFTDLISVNMHALLDRAENPERMLAHLLRTLEEDLAAARLQAARVIAGERSLRRELDQHRAAVEHWKEQARLALAQNREDLARRALTLKIDHDDLAGALAVQHDAAQQLSAEVKAGLRVLQQRLAQARHRHSLLMARQRAAQVRLEVERSIRGNLADDYSRLDHLERRLVAKEDDLLAQVEVSRLDSDLETELAGCQRMKRIEEELVNLQKEAGNSPGGSP
jgi:phage shock protein A